MRIHGDLQGSIQALTLHRPSKYLQPEFGNGPLAKLGMAREGTETGLCGLPGMDPCIDPFGCSRASSGLPCASDVFGPFRRLGGAAGFLSPSLGSAKEDIPRNASCGAEAVRLSGSGRTMPSAEAQDKPPVLENNPTTQPEVRADCTFTMVRQPLPLEFRYLSGTLASRRRETGDSCSVVGLQGILEDTGCETGLCVSVAKTVTMGAPACENGDDGGGQAGLGDARRPPGRGPQAEGGDELAVDHGGPPVAERPSTPRSVARRYVSPARGAPRVGELARQVQPVPSFGAWSMPPPVRGEPSPKVQLPAMTGMRPRPSCRCRDDLRLATGAGRDDATRHGDGPRTRAPVRHRVDARQPFLPGPGGGRAPNRATGRRSSETPSRAVVRQVGRGIRVLRGGRGGGERQGECVQHGPA